MPYIFDCPLGNSAPPYIIIASSIAQVIAIIGIIKQYRDSNVDIDKVSFGYNFLKSAHYIKALMTSTLVVLVLSVANIIFCLASDIQSYVELYIKIFFGFSSLSFFFGLFEYYTKFKEELKAQREA